MLSWTAATAMSITGGSALDNCFVDIVGEGAKTFLNVDSSSKFTGIGYVLQNDGAINLASGAVYNFSGCNLEFGDGACGVRSSNGTWVFPGSQGEPSLSHAQRGKRKRGHRAHLVRRRLGTQQQLLHRRL